MITLLISEGSCVACCPVGSLGTQLAALLSEFGELACFYLDRFLDDLKEFFQAVGSDHVLQPGSDPERLAKEFLYMYEGSLLVCAIRATTEPFKEAVENFIGTHFRAT